LQRAQPGLELGLGRHQGARIETQHQRAL
jgi:hypothetical protein